jgi:ppGpp synthetase/RelA/SpoT-type nucleotidyltranferase
VRVAFPLSKSQVERLGKRLVASDQPEDADLQLLHEVLLSRSGALEVAIARVRDHLQLAPTSRIKNTGTIFEKLRRSGGSGLKSMQDLAGMRIVGTFDRRGQDEITQRVCVLFADEKRAPKIIDRRVAPMHGYAAVHVVVFPDDAPIEIQIRTAWQHEWAELFEKLADLVGRGIRYGEPPQRWSPPSEIVATHQTSRLHGPVDYDVRVSMVEIARELAEIIDIVETDEVIAVDDPERDTRRQGVDRVLAKFRKAVEMLPRL